MKKIFILCFMCILLSGCVNDYDEQNDYSNYEHYHLKDKRLNSYIDEDGNYYVVADITEEEQDEGGVNGIFYKVGSNDYILLDKVECCGYADSYYDNSHTLFYKNKLYVLRCTGFSFYEYSFNGNEFIKEDLLLKFNSDYHLSSIKKVDDDFIYLNSYSNYEYKNIKCSLDTYNCEEYD